MKYTCSIDIKLPVSRVVELWENESYFKEWQDGFESIELLSGEANAVGAKSKILIHGKQKMELIETILVYNLPKEKTASYEHIHMTNLQTSRFKEIDANSTQYISEVTYTQFNGFLIKLIAKLFPSKFKEQSQKWMNQFKEFSEKQD